jgi:hypothetical protein
MLHPDVPFGAQHVDQRSEVYIEFVVHATSVKVTAIDSKTGVEASIVGPANAPRDGLSALAVRKLEYVLRKKAC